ncbi:Myb-related protein A [Orchesella cincta]|uniref:Myb-related protein A n=1 Tax=Orchesella cincta TaxID=48709 RepID=A0A1D2MNM2_ORCCI|nr:Myb-related protein A [Orchesella cincta]
MEPFSKGAWRSAPTQPQVQNYIIVDNLLVPENNTENESVKKRNKLESKPQRKKSINRGRGPRTRTRDSKMPDRWSKVLSPNLIKGQWTKEEDDKVVLLVNQYGPKKWTLIAKHLKGRIGKQCRERWHNHLNPDINKAHWSETEDNIIIDAHAKWGNQEAPQDQARHQAGGREQRKQLFSFFDSGIDSEVKHESGQQFDSERPDDNARGGGQVLEHVHRDSSPTESSSTTSSTTSRPSSSSIPTRRCTLQRLARPGIRRAVADLNTPTTSIMTTPKSSRCVSSKTPTPLKRALEEFRVSFSSPIKLEDFADIIKSNMLSPSTPSKTLDSSVLSSTSWIQDSLVDEDVEASNLWLNITPPGWKNKENITPGSLTPASGSLLTTQN